MVDTFFIVVIIIACAMVGFCLYKTRHFSSGQN